MIILFGIHVYVMLEFCRVVTLLAVVFQMKSIGYKSSDSSLFLETDRQKPSLREGDVLIKVGLLYLNRVLENLTN